MSKKNQPFKPARRRFMRTVAFSGGAAVMLGKNGNCLASEEQSAQASQAELQQERASGYHLTEHIREYYRKAAF